MEIGSPVYSVETFPTRQSQLAVGCESGSLSIYDVVSSTEISIFAHDGPIVAIRSVDPNSFYGATETHIFFQDIREGRPPKVLFQSPSEIYDLSARPPLLAIATLSNDIILSDSRMLRKPPHCILPSVCSSLAFSDDSHIVAGYLDTVIGFWDLQTVTFSPLSNLEAVLINPDVVHSLSARDGYVIVAKQNGVAVYHDGRLLADSLFEHSGPPQAIAFADCFGGRPFAVSGAADGSLMVLNLETLEPLDCLCIDGEKIQCIASNQEFIAVADTSETGNIAIFEAEAFEGN